MTELNKKNQTSTDPLESPIEAAPDSELEANSKESSVPSDTEDSPEQLLAAAREEARSNYERLLRVSAEFENYKKRSQREIQDFRKYANEALLKALLPVVDDLERAISSARDALPAIAGEQCVVDGVELILKELLKVLENFAVKPIEALGQPFDPNFHQAVMQEATDSQPENMVLQEFQKGYLIHDRLLRPSMVVVSKQP